MFNPVHGEKLLVCQWTGEAFPAKQRFYVPQPGKSEGRRWWAGCFGSPGAAISAIKEESGKSKLNADQTHELFDEFEATLRRKPGKEKEKFTICAAPHFSQLKNWGGALDIQEFHRVYQHDTQIELFYQVIPPRTDVDESAAEAPPAQGATPKGIAERWAKEADEDSDPERPANAPRRWHDTKIGIGRRDETRRVVVPRGLSGVVGWMKRAAAESDCKDACIVYFHPTSDTSFALGNPKDWQAEGNRMASDFLGKCTVFGHVKLMSKAKLRESKKRPGAALAEEPSPKAQK